MRHYLLAFLLAAAAPAWAQGALIDNPRVTATKVRLAPGRPYTTDRHTHDAVLLIAGDGRLTTDGKAAARHFGDAVFIPKGKQVTEEVKGGTAIDLVEVVLKDSRPPHPNTTGYPLGFPRPGAKNTLNNNRAAVWLYTWGPHETTPMHYHDKDIVGVFRYDGPLKSTDPTGKSTIIRYGAGEVRFTPGDRSHTEGLVSGRQSAILMELK
jgi:mannose-6-phosphate isomerase-like protein (cupin superfamily)